MSSPAGSPTGSPPGAEDTAAILGYFEEICRIPRRSKQEERIAERLTGWADSEGFESARDAAGNLVIRIPATPGREADPVTVLQGHLDMVCEKTTASNHDFERDPIRTRTEGEWLTAEGTTLGADNGIAIAIAQHAAITLASRPPLELLFTVDEETGLTGARNLDASLLRGRRLINIDSEDEGVVTIGCAGGCDAVLELPVSAIVRPDGAKAAKLSVSGLSGGHSGVDISRQLGNANRLLARTLAAILARPDGCGVVGFGACTGGSARNAIPRDASIVLYRAHGADAAETGELAEVAAECEATFRRELTGVDEPRITVEAVEPAGRENPAQPVASTLEDLRRLTDLLLALPTGVARMSADVPGLVESSNNLAVVDRKPARVTVTLSQRSSFDSRIEELTRRIEAVASLAGADSVPRMPIPRGRPRRRATSSSSRRNDTGRSSGRRSRWR